MNRAEATAGFNQYRGIYLKRIPTYSFPLMLDVMRELGVDSELILKNTGLEPNSLAREGTMMSFLQALKFVRNLLRHSPRPDIGLHIGDHYHISTYGVLGYAMMSCATWVEALRLGGRFHRVASSLVAIELEIDEERDTLAYVVRPFYPDMDDVEPFTVEKLFASLIAVSRPVMPEPAYPHKVSFRYPKPDYASAYAKLFPSDIEFNAAENRFEIALSKLQQPLLAANDVCAQMGRRMCEEHLGIYNRVDDSPHRRVTEILLAAPRGMPDMEAVAEELHMSSRTLRRALQEEGTTFQQICDELRHDLAKHYLMSSKLNLDDIAHLVGFTESTNFRRAFKRWHGIPPAQYRRQRRAEMAG